MKKVFMVCLLILLAAIPAFSANNQIGVVTGPAFFFGKMNSTSSGVTTSESYNTVDYTIGIRGANYFTKYVGIGYGADLYIPISNKTEGVDTKSSTPAYYFDVSVNVQGKYDISSALAVTGGLGVSYQYGSRSMTGTGYTYKFAMSYFKLFADLGVSYTITNNVLLNGGLRIATPLTTNVTISATGGSVSISAIKARGVSILPYVGVAYAY